MKTSTLKNNKDMIHFNLFNQDELSGRKSRFLAILQLLRRVVAICLLALASVGAWAADYVFMQGSNYIIISGGSLTTTTTFNPSTCLWSGTSGGAFTNNGNTLKYSQDSPSGSGTFYYTTTLNTSGTNVPLVISADGTIQFTANVSATYYNIIFISGWDPTPGTWYIQCNGSNVVASTTSSSTNIKAYAYTTFPATIDALAITGTQTSFSEANENHQFSHTDATYYASYGRYSIGSADYYWYESSFHDVAPSPSAELTYTWSLSSNMSGFAAVDNTGKVTYSNLVPEPLVSAELICTATHTSEFTQTVTLPLTFINDRALPKPVINITPNGSTATVTITGEDGTTIYYTTNGDDPESTSSYETSPVTLTNVANLTIIKAYASKTGFSNSIVAVNQFVTSGVVNDVVYLNDYEDHTWTYYAGVDESVDGGNYNTNYAGKMYSPDPRNVKITYQANGGAVSIDEAETTFVYYKTIEKVGGTYKYQVISNPFSKRPTGKGFGGWEVVSGGSYIGKNTGDVLALDEELTLTAANLKNVAGGDYVSNCTSAEIVLKAHWVNATITNITSNTNTTIANSGTYETNLVVVKCGFDRTLTINGPCTIMMVEPDGSADYRTYTLETGITPPTGGIAKIEFAKWDPDGNIAMAGRNLWIGRGVTCSGTTRSVTLAGNNGTINQVAKIESGSFTTLTHYSSKPTGITKQILVLGNDYDRANSDNTKLTFSGRFEVSACNVGGYVEACRVYSKSGSFMTGTAISTAARSYSYYMSQYTTTGPKVRRYLEIEGGEWYASINGGQDNNSTTVDTEHDLFVFRMRGGKVRGCVYGAAEQTNSSGNRVMVFTGGQVGGWICGASNGTSTSGGVLYGKTFVYFGGNAECNTKYQERTPAAIRNSLGGYVYASGCGSSATSHVGEVTQGTNIVMADNAKVQYGVYGGGAYGYSSGTANVYVTGGQVESSYDASYNVYCGVYGGARQNDAGPTNVYMTGGLIEGNTHNSIQGGGLFGGSNAQGDLTGSVKMVVTGGQVGTSTNPANIHGGGYGQPTIVEGNVDVTIGADGAERDADGPVIYGDVYGGSALGNVNGITSTGGLHTNVTLNAGTINGSLYGGGLGDNSHEANVFGVVQVTVNGGSVRKTDENGANGSGGVYGCNNINGAPQNNVSVDIYGTNSAPSEDEYAIYAIYGGGNQADYEYEGYENPSVTVHNCDNSIEYIYGGGNAADVPNTYVTIYGGNKIGNVFGGGNGQNGEANVTGEVGTYVMIYGGTIGNVYGGSNAAGSIAGDLYVGITPGYNDGEYVLCPLDIDNVYGGGNQADSKAGNLEINCSYPTATFHIGSVYGGANQANITEGNIELNITAGNIDNVFGGNNISGNISGSITVNINDDGLGCGMEVGNVYGGGNLATYTAPTASSYGTKAGKFPEVNIINGKINHNVFGGGKGDATDATHATGAVTGNPQVTIGSTTNTDVVTIDGNVFGGGDAANVAGSPVVLVQNCNTKIGTTSTTDGVTTYTNGSVYGGGNAAHVTGSSNSTSVTINGGTINRVFGGGNGEVSAANVEGSANTTIHAGTIHQAFAGSNAAGTISGTAKITVDKTGSCGEKIDELYGGGNLAEGNAGTVTVACGAIVDDVYGGANQAKVTSDITLNITGGTIKRVFGGNNTSGNITGSITVNINKASDCESFSVENVYGAGNQASYTPSSVGSYPAVNIKNGTVSQNVYGGGLGASATVTSNPVVTLMGGTVTGNIFGGGDAAPVTGNPAVVANYGSTTNIYAGGKGATAIVTGNPTATINLTPDKTLNVTDVFGGGDAAAVQAPTSGTSVCTVNMQAGTVSHIYGGGNQAGVSTTDVNVSGGAITDGLYGGCNTSGTVTGTIAVDVTGGTIGTSSDPANVHGGGYGNATATGDNVAVTINGASAVINGDVYGGSALGSVNDASTETTTVTLTSGTIYGDLYGGGLGDNTYAAGVAGSTVVAINGGTVNNVFGCNNANGAPTTGASVTVNGGTINNNVYGGGNLAAAAVSPVVTINNGTLPGSVFGGGKGNASDDSHETAMVTGNPQVIIGDDNGSHSVSIAGNVFGGGDAANVKGATTVTVNKCNTLIGAKTDGVWSTTAGTVYGGGNAADVVKNGTTGGSTSVVVNGGDIYRVFGGGNGEGTDNPGANVANGTNVAIHAGNIHQAFAGSNAKGNITGTSIVTIDHDISTCNELIDEVYGGGNLAAGNAGAVTVECGAIISDLYGGANQADIGTSTNPSNITLNVTGGTINRVFGGNNTSGNIYGSITVNVEKADDCGLDLNYVYGAGNQASYAPTTAGAYPAVNILKGTVKKDVFGGGLGSTAVVTSNPTILINGGSVTGNVFGGGSEANTVGTTSVTVRTGSVGADVYGGGALANITGNTTVSLTGGTVTGNIYGGGLGRQADAEHSIAAVAANVTGTTSVTISDGEVSNVFGCNNINGAPTTGASVTVNGGDISSNVYGGGNLAAASVSPEVTINNGTLPGSVFGGGLGASAIITGNPLVTIGNNDDEQLVIIRGNVFGGGDAANVAGKPKVVINDCNTVIGTYTEEDGTIVWDATDGTVYGGGNAADITGLGNGTDVTINGGKIHRAFGGGNGAGEGNPGANVAGNTLLTIKGGTVGEAFGGSNARGTIGGEPNVVIGNADGDCELNILDIYGGGNETPSAGGHLIVEGCKHIRNVYGGANNADITSDIEVTIRSGYIQNVFGGNNNGGTIAGSIIVNIDWDGSDCWNVDNVYGAGNLATYTAPTTSTYGDKAGKFPEVNIKNGKVNYNVFGAGKGDGSKFGSTEVYKGQVTGNPQVKLIGGSCKNIYGGGEGAPVNGNTNVTINATDRPANEGEYHVEECVFGGGLGATAVINGSTNITITGSSAIHGNVYGGGNAGLVTGDTHIDIK